MLFYDIIGDIHGHSDELEVLLQKLGYIKANGVYSHPGGRKVVFVGDFIDRGPKIRETLHLVRDMVLSGNALAVMGNHEYNAVCFHTPNLHSGGYYRKHNFKEIHQHYETLKQFKDFSSELKMFLDWFRHLPMFLELDSFKVVHAYWNDEHINWLKENYKHDTIGLNADFLHAVSVKESKAFKAVEETLKGPEQQLPEGQFMVDKDGTERRECRLKWWSVNKSKMGEAIMHCPDYLLENSMPEGSDLRIFQSEKPVFFGHYWLHDNPIIENKSAICLDYSVAKGGKLVAARMEGDKLKLIY
jgi:hypothetical protein